MLRLGSSDASYTIIMVICERFCFPYCVCVLLFRLLMRRV